MLYTPRGLLGLKPWALLQRCNESVISTALHCIRVERNPPVSLAWLYYKNLEITLNQCIIRAWYGSVSGYHIRCILVIEFWHLKLSFRRILSSNA